VIIPDLVAHLLQQSTLTDLVSSRVYPQKLPQNPKLPALTYSQVSAVRVRELSGPAYKARRRISIHCWATTYKAAHELAGVVRQILDPFDGHFADTVVGHISLDNEFDLFEEEAGTVGIYRVVQDYIFAHLED
jgi:hypothetical protein